MKLKGGGRVSTLLLEQRANKSEAIQQPKVTMASTGIFETNEFDGILFEAWNNRKKQIDRERLQPYADLLLLQVILPHIQGCKNLLFQELKEKCEKALHPSELFTTIWSFNHVHDYPKNALGPWGPPHAFALERGDEQAQKVEQIHVNGWRQYVSVEDEDGGWMLPPRTVYDIVKKTDLLQQLALFFGRNFRVSMSPPEVFTVKAPNGEEYSRSKISLHLHAYPYGLPKHFREHQKQHLEAFGKRGYRHLTMEDVFIFWRGAPVEQSPVASSPPPLPPSPSPPPLVRVEGRWPSSLPEGMCFAPPSYADNSFHYRGCYCGCDDSDDE